MLYCAACTHRTLVPRYSVLHVCAQQVGVWHAQDQVAMTDQLADGFFLSKKTSMGAQSILAQCVSTDQPVLLSVSGREAW